MVDVFVKEFLVPFPMAILSSGWAFAFLIFSTHLINFSAHFPSGLSLLPQEADSLFLLEPQE